MKIFWIMEYLAVLTQPPRVPHMNLVSLHLIAAFSKTWIMPCHIRNKQKAETYNFQDHLLSNFKIYVVNIRVLGPKIDNTHICRCYRRKV